MPRQPDDWEYSRNPRDGFTKEEMLRIRVAFREGVKARDLARELKCNTRMIDLRYAQMGGKRVESPTLRAAARRVLPDRHYRSNFEL